MEFETELMFGDGKNLILPIIFDIANLVKKAALNLKPDINDKDDNGINRRSYKIELNDGINNDYEYVDEMLDPQNINEGILSLAADKNNLTKKRSKRSSEILDRYIQLGQSVSGETDNATTTTTSFPNEFNEHITVQPNRNEISENLTSENNFASDIFITDDEKQTFNNLNNTDQHAFQNDTSSLEAVQELPKPEGLIRSRPKQKVNSLHKKLEFHNSWSSRRSCERFTGSVCIGTNDYPMQQIMGSIRRHQYAMSALLAEYRDKQSDNERMHFSGSLPNTNKRREDEFSASNGMCSSVVRYARPQKARSATGEWKFIVNTGEHTQTLRLEKCSDPGESCSYLTENYRSHCEQIYNYHRLLTWDKERGLHVDIFKVPTCCSCHVDGYRDLFPPLSGIKKGNKKSTIRRKENPFSTAVDDEIFEDGVKDVNNYPLKTNFENTKRNKHDPFKSKQNYNMRFDLVNDKSKSSLQSQNLERYLYPPHDNMEIISHANSNWETLPERSRKPIQKYFNPDVNDRIDQEIGVKSDKEVTVFSSIDMPAVRPKPPSVSTAQPQITADSSISRIPSTVTADDNTRNSNSIFYTKLPNTRYSVNKRINYDYHPIIDFFSLQLPARKEVISLKAKNGHKFNYITSTERSFDNSWRPVE